MVAPRIDMTCADGIKVSTFDMSTLDMDMTEIVERQLNQISLVNLESVGPWTQ
jgi:hypothetical protein